MLVVIAIGQFVVLLRTVGTHCVIDSPILI